MVKFHGPRPTAAANRVWVANHTSMIDYIVLTSYSPFAVIMQLHAGWVGFLQTKVSVVLGGAEGCWRAGRLCAADRQSAAAP